MTKKSLTKNKLSLREAARTSTNRLHLVPISDGWSIKREGAIKSSGIFKTKKEALNRATTIKQKSAIVIHKKDGTIERWSQQS